MVSEEPINILMVDDSATNLLALESILHAPDINLVSASSGDDALRYLLHNEVAVILLDVYMPGIDGLETAELIRGREKSRNIPIIFLTADSTGGRHLSRGYSLGAVDYIVKPIEPDILRSKVQVFVELFKKTREIRRQAQLLREKNLQLENTNLARLGMLINLGQELAAEHDPSRVLQKFCRSARKIVEAEEAGIGVLGRPGEKLRYFVCSPKNKRPSRNGRPPVADEALKWILDERRPLRLNETDALLRVANGNDSVQSFLGAPLLSGDGVSGWVYLVNKLHADDFSEADERLAATLATQVAISYENALLYTNAQRHAEALQLEISERRQAEDEKARLLVREQSARAEAEQANRTKDEFLATLSHELRTPLSAILGWSHLVRSGKLDEPQMSRAFETIERNARSQSQLIDDLLDVSRIITGKLQIERHSIDLTIVIESAVEAVRPAFEAKTIDFTVEFERDNCFVPGDSNRLQQIFWNLFSNSIKFTPNEGKVNVAVNRDDSTVQISISDTGIGISPDFLPYIFDRFRQADGSTTRIHGGLGLGLAIVRHLLELHEGTIDVKSEGPGQGSTFIVSLPVASAPLETNFEFGEVVEGANGNPESMAKILEGVRILVVDDEADSRELISTVLTRYGCEVRCSESAAEAIRAVAEWKPNLLLTDIGMPHEDGYSLIKRLRKMRSDWARQLPAIALTAYATTEDRDRALAAGFRMHLPKPIEPATLAILIANALGRKV